MAAKAHSISSQTKERQSGLKAQLEGHSADAPPTFTTSLHSIFESEDAYDSDTGAFQQHVPSVTEYISGVIGRDSDVEVNGSEDEFNEGSDISLSINMDNNILEDELDRDIMQLMYCPKPMAARGALKSQKWQPGRPKGSSKPVLTGPVSDEELETYSKL